MLEDTTGTGYDFKHRTIGECHRSVHKYECVTGEGPFRRVSLSEREPLTEAIQHPQPPARTTPRVIWSPFCHPPLHPSSPVPQHPSYSRSTSGAVHQPTVAMPLPLLNISEDASVTEVAERLGDLSLPDDVIEALKANKVDGFSLFLLDLKELEDMLPPASKGPAMKLMKLISTQKTSLEEAMDTFSQPILESTRIDDSSVASTSGLSSPSTSSAAGCRAQPMSLASPNSTSIIGDVPLPIYSARVKASIDMGVVDLNSMVSETAYHILAHHNIKTSTDYEQYVGKLMQVYPCISHPGKEKWSFFGKKLSQKCRNTRWRFKKRSSILTGRRPRRTIHLATADVSTDDDHGISVNDAAVSITAELLKPTEEQDIPFLTRLHRSTFRQRRTEITSVSDGLVGEVVSRFTLLGDIRFIRQEFAQLCSSTANMQKQYDVMVDKLKAVMSDSGTNEEVMNENLHTLMELQTAIKLKRGKKVLQDVLSVVDAADINTVTCSRKDPPRLVVVNCEDGDNMTGILLADNIRVTIINAPLWQLIADLVGAYYAWDLSYPKAYQLLAFLQIHYLQDDNNKISRGAGMTVLEKKYNGNGN